MAFRICIVVCALLFSQHLVNTQANLELKDKQTGLTVLTCEAETLEWEREELKVVSKVGNIKSHKTKSLVETPRNCAELWALVSNHYTYQTAAYSAELSGSEMYNGTYAINSMIAKNGVLSVILGKKFLPKINLKKCVPIGIGRNGGYELFSPLFYNKEFSP